MKNGDESKEISTRVSGHELNEILVKLWQLADQMTRVVMDLGITMDRVATLEKERRPNG